MDEFKQIRLNIERPINVMWGAYVDCFGYNTQLVSRTIIRNILDKAYLSADTQWEWAHPDVILM